MFVAFEALLLNVMLHFRRINRSVVILGIVVLMNMIMIAAMVMVMIVAMVMIVTVVMMMVMSVIMMMVMVLMAMAVIMRAAMGSFRVEDFHDIEVAA